MKRFPVLLPVLAVLFLFGQCNEKCKDMANSEEGDIKGKFDFGESCFLYARVDSTLVIASDSAFNKFKNEHFKNCNAGTVPAIDFSQQALLGYMVKVPACNAAFHRKVVIDNTAKVFRYTISIEKCTGCNTLISSPNFVLVPAIPPGYSVVFETK